MLENLDDTVLKCPMSKAVVLFFLSHCDEKPFFRTETFLLKSNQEVQEVKTKHWLSIITLEKNKLCWRLSLYPPEVVMQLYKKLAYTRPYVFAEILLYINPPHKYMIGFDDAGHVRQTINAGRYVIHGAEHVKIHTPPKYTGVMNSIDFLTAKLKQTIQQCQDELQVD